MYRVDVRGYWGGGEGLWKLLGRGDGTIVWLVVDYHGFSWIVYWSYP